LSTAPTLTELHERYVMSTYAPGLTLVKGRGTRVWDDEGRAYLDFLSGIAVTNIGHCHPHLVKAIRRQAGTLMHVSNLFYNTLQPRLAEALSTRSLGGKCFFCNSGAEANEGLIKLARLWGKAEGRYEIITFRNSFHGRTLATLTATGQDKVQQGFEPLPAGFAYADYNDINSVHAAITDKTVAVLVESVQGEGGVRPARPDFMKDLEALCCQKGLLLLCDEVQSGMGRTGHWFGYQRCGVTPAAISTAKGLGGGFPIGAIITGETLANVFQPGSHGTTFGGTPLACAAALAVIEVIEREHLLTHAARMGELFAEKLKQVAAKHGFIREVRGAGLMIGLVLNEPAKPLEQLLRNRGLIALATAETVLRFLPPLTVKPREVRKAARIVEQACDEWSRQQQQPGPDDVSARFKHLKLNADR
jgi:acetylornithine/N-succinyldiaminopimelate aminotransferase